MTESTAIQKAPTPIEAMTTYLRSDAVRQRFAETLGSPNVGAYVSSILVAVAESKNLQACTLESVFLSGIRAASLRLSVDPSAGQAYLVPFGAKATLIVGYKGLYDMAVRTGRYRYINVVEIFDGMTIEPDPISGRITYASLKGGRKSNKVVGWLGSFEFLDGFGHEIYMSVEDIHKHAKHYSKSYNFKDAPWQTDPSAMERKTVLRLLLRRWGYLDHNDKLSLDKAEDEDPVILDVVPEPTAPVEKPKLTEAEHMAALGFKEDKPKKKAKSTSAPEPAQEPVEFVPNEPSDHFKEQLTEDTAYAKAAAMTARGSDDKQHRIDTLTASQLGYLIEHSSNKDLVAAAELVWAHNHADDPAAP